MSAGPPTWPRIDGALDDVNEDFHSAYDTVRSAASTDPPVLIFLGDSLIVHLRGQRREQTVTPRLYHAIKAASHAPLALYSALYPRALADERLDEEALRRLDAIRAHTRASQESLAVDVPHSGAQAELRSILHATLASLEQVAAAGSISHAALDAFAGSCGPALLRLMDHATGIQLDALHAAVESTLANMSAAEKEALQVVVAGAHQARERSLAMQYFRKRFHEPAGAEERVAYAENAGNEAAALALVGTRRFDRAIASAFFGDERRLQRDLLGDAAAARLSRIEIK